jgi:hypothetical protein
LVFDPHHPVGYTISMKRVFELVRQALERYPMLEAQALRVLWMSRYEEAWAHLQPSMRKGNPRSIEVGMKVAGEAGGSRYADESGGQGRWQRHTARDHPAGDGAGGSADGGRYAGTGTAAAGDKRQ